MKNKITTDTVTYKFVGETIKSSFNSIEDALEYVNSKNRLPANGKSWIIEEIHNKIIQHTIISNRKVIDNKEITKNIVNYFIEHATVDNVKFDTIPQFFINPEHRNFRCHVQLYSFLCIEKYLGYTKEQYWKLYNELCNKYKNDRYVSLNSICIMICYYAMAEKYGFNREKIFNTNFTDYNILINEIEKNNPLITKERTYWLLNLYLADGHDHLKPGKYEGINEPPNIWRYMSVEELLNYYKEELKKIPIEDFEWEYNIGNYKPCHNYKLNIKHNNISDNECSIHMYGHGLPGIMFRDEDIYVTDSNYIGRHVSHTNTLAVDVNEDLYNYCIKNLS